MSEQVSKRIETLVDWLDHWFHEFDREDTYFEDPLQEVAKELELQFIASNKQAGAEVLAACIKELEQGARDKLAYAERMSGGSREAAKRAAAHYEASAGDLRHLQPTAADLEELLREEREPLKKRIADLSTQLEKRCLVCRQTWPIERVFRCFHCKSFICPECAGEHFAELEKARAEGKG